MQMITNYRPVPTEDMTVLTSKLETEHDHLNPGRRLITALRAEESPALCNYLPASPPSINPSAHSCCDHRKLSSMRIQDRTATGHSFQAIPTNNASTANILGQSSHDNVNHTSMGNTAHNTTASNSANMNSQDVKTNSTKRFFSNFSKKENNVSISASGMSNNGSVCNPQKRILRNNTGNTGNIGNMGTQSHTITSAQELFSRGLSRSANNQKVLTDFLSSPLNQTTLSGKCGVYLTELNSMPYIMQGRVNSEGKPTGTCEYYSKTDPSKLEMVVSYDEDGLKDGKQLEFYPNGKLKVSTTYERDSKDGKQLEFYEDGSIKSLKTYENNIIAGNSSYDQDPAHIEYYPGNGIPKSIISYNEDGEKDGVCLSMDTKGRIIEKGRYSEGEKVGSWETYAYNRRASEPTVTTIEYTDDEYNDDETVDQQLPKDYDSIGDLKQDEYGLLHGEQVYKANIEYTDGTAGVEIRRTTYSHGVKQGTTRVEDEHGELLTETKYNYGLKSHQTLYDDGVKETTITMQYGLKHGKEVRIAENNTWDDPDNENIEDSCSRQETEYRFGQEHGKQIFYDENKKIRFKDEYQFGEIEGIRQEFDADGRLESLEEFHDDEQNGIAIELDTFGNITEMGYYMNDEQHGERRLVENGKVVEVATFHRGELEENKAYDINTAKNIATLQI